jgi:hypothetical protein
MINLSTRYTFNKCFLKKKVNGDLKKTKIKNGIIYFENFDYC